MYLHKNSGNVGKVVLRDGYARFYDLLSDGVYTVEPCEPLLIIGRDRAISMLNGRILSGFIFDCGMYDEI